jgi:hypothetical protein
MISSPGAEQDVYTVVMISYVVHVFNKMHFYILYLSDIPWIHICNLSLQL